jgi:hypothetical protein
MNVTSVAISVLITVKLDDLNSHSAAAAEIVGEEMARQVAGYTQKKKLGYYPPLEYFKELDDVDPDLIDAIDNVAWLATRLVREEVRRRLRPVFASLRIDALQNLVFTMPRVRPGNASSMQQLTEHFTPNKVRIELTASIINRDTTEKDFKRYTSHLVHRWLADHFENVDVVSCRQTGANTGKSNTS